MPSEKRARQRALRDQKLAVQERQDRRSRRVRRSITLIVVIGVIIALVALLSGGGTKKPTTASKSTSTTTTIVPPTTEPAAKAAVAPVCPPATAAGAAKRVIVFTKAPPMCVAPNSVFDATVVTDLGTFVIKLTTASSPAAVNNFVFLARYHFYNGLIFQRVVPGFVIQGGDPTGTGAGGPGYQFTGNEPPSACVAKADCYVTGSVALANAGKPTSDGSQFFVVVPGGASELSDLYSLIGQVTSGMNVVEKIADTAVSSTNKQPPKNAHYMVSVTIKQINA